MNKLMIPVSLIGLATVCSAAFPYTNTWNTVEGSTSIWNWRDAANWNVQYGAPTPAPASTAPTADSLTFLNKQANITLDDGDDVHLGETWFLASVFDRTLNIAIPSGARMSLDGTGAKSYFGTEKWRDKSSVNNKTTLDVNGGDLVLGQNVFYMRCNKDTAYDKPPLNHILARNGGTISLTNGCWIVLGGETGQSTGKGDFTNVIDVLSGGTLEIKDAGWLQFGDYEPRPSRNNPRHYSSGGYLNVKGGHVICSNCTGRIAIVVGGHAQAGCGTYITVSDNGVMDFGGKEMAINTANTNILRVTSGGKVNRLGDFGVSNGGYQYASYHNMLEVDGGTVELDSYHPGKETAGNGGRTTFRIHGWIGYSLLAIENIGAHCNWYYKDSGTAPWFLDCRLAPHTPRGVRFPMAPLLLTSENYTKGNADAVNLYGVNRISPDGGVQLVHAKKFPIVMRPHDGSVSYNYMSSFRFVGTEMWTNTIATIGNGNDTELRSLVKKNSYAYVFYAGLKDEAKLTDGETLATPVPRAWLPLPKFTAKQLNTNRTERISVRLDLVAPETGTLDLAKVVKNIQDNGYPGACVDNKVAGYNVRVDLPMDELAADTTDDSVVLDFVEINDYPQATGLVPFMTNALIRAATCETKKIERALIVLIK